MRGLLLLGFIGMMAAAQSPQVTPFSSSTAGKKKVTAKKVAVKKAAANKARAVTSNSKTPVVAPRAVVATPTATTAQSAVTTFNTLSSTIAGPQTGPNTPIRAGTAAPTPVLQNAVLAYPVTPWQIAAQTPVAPFYPPGMPMTAAPTTALPMAMPTGFGGMPNNNNPNQQVPPIQRQQSAMVTADEAKYGTTTRSPASTGATGKKATTPNPITSSTSRACAPEEVKTNPWDSTKEVTDKGLLPENSRSPAATETVKENWPKIVPDGTNKNTDGSQKYKVQLSGTNSTNMSATATAYMQHVVDLLNSGQVHFEDAGKQLATINGDKFKNAFKGDTFAVAKLNQYLGGHNAFGEDPAAVKKALGQARAGDIFKFERADGTTESSIFKGTRGSDACFWTSSEKNKGPAIDCEPIASLKSVAVSHMPGPSTLAGDLADFKSDKSVKGFDAPDDANKISMSDLQENDSIPCDSPSGGGRNQAAAKGSSGNGAVTGDADTPLPVATGVVTQ
jgi:hypothetical protein